MTTVIFQRYSSPQISFEGLPLAGQVNPDEDKSWYYKYENKTFGPFLTKKDAEDDIQIRIMKYKT
jgi:hypothetical protein